MFKKLKAIKAAAQAGWIAERCPRCYSDDATESIFPCPQHEAKIAELSNISLTNW